MKLLKDVLIAVVILLIALTCYYASEYLCKESPHVPVRCKPFPWEN